METIQVVLDAKLPRAVQKAAKKQNVNRCALVRHALEAHLMRLHVLDLEERDRRRYQAKPQKPDEYVPWENAAAWPADLAGVISISADSNGPTSNGRYSYSLATALLITCQL